MFLVSCEITGVLFPLVFQSICGSEVPSFPTKIAMKLLWVWLGDGEPQGHPKDILKGAVGMVMRFWDGVGGYSGSANAKRQPLGVRV